MQAVENNKNKINKKRKRKLIGRIFTIILLSITLILFGSLFYLNVIPVIYTIILLVVTLLIIFGLFLCNFSKKKGFRLIGYFFSSLLILIFMFIEIYLYNTLGFLFNATNGNFMLKTYNVVVLNDSNYNDIKDLNNKTIGIYNVDSSLEKMQKELNKKIKINYDTYDSREDLVFDLISKNIDSIILESSELSLMEENDKENFDKLKTIYQIEIKSDISSLKDAININKEPFNIYISGIDTYGKINSVSRSDVNILVSVNPKTEKILITWIPRDYYVDINKGSKDKLTHAGMYGIDSSIYAIEKLLDVNINYYVKVNFTSVVKVVDALNGITVYNDETFTTNDNFTFYKGEVNLNGEEALSFVRDRKHVTGGDVGRGKNQIKVLEALINKALSKDIIKNYNKLLSSLNGSFVTNMNQATMTSFIRKEIQNRRNWQIESYTLVGTDANEYTYSVKEKPLYVMIPDNDAIKEVKDKIKEIVDN